MTYQMNLNDTVKYKITDAGIAHLKKKHDDFNSKYKTDKPLLGDFIPPKADEDGWITTQLWCLMSDFGETISMGGICIIHTNILIVDAPAK